MIYNNSVKDIFSKILNTGNRRYYFDIKETKIGDYYISITESKKVYINNKISYNKNRLLIYKEVFTDFLKYLNEFIDYVYDKKGKEVILDKKKKTNHKYKKDNLNNVKINNYNNPKSRLKNKPTKNNRSRRNYKPSNKPKIHDK